MKDEQVYGRNLDLGPPLQGKIPSKSQINRGYDLIQNYFSSFLVFFWGGGSRANQMSSILHGPSVQLKLHMIGKPFHHEPKRKPTGLWQLILVSVAVSYVRIFSSDFIDCRKYENVFNVGCVPGRDRDPAKSRVSLQPVQERLKCKYID